MSDLTNIFNQTWTPPPAHKINTDPTEIQLAQAMLSAGVEPPSDIKIDGQLHRFSTRGRKKDDSGWYIIFPDGVPAGAFGCWRDGISVNWKANVGRELTAAENMAHTMRMAEARAAREAAQALRHETASNTVEQIWANAGAASPDHPYLKRKGVQPHGARVTGDGRLMVPLYNASGALSSLQYISEDSSKKYHPGGKTKACIWVIGDPDQTIYIAEGFATAATIHEATGDACAIGYTASGLVDAAEFIRAQYPQSSIVIVADNDASGIGKNKAEQAAAKFGARVIVPPLQGDANDYRNVHGQDLTALLNPPQSNWLTRAKDFSSEPAPIKWLVKRWVQDQALIMVHGPSGGGKTFVVLDWCLHIASELTDWHGQKIHPGGVVYLAGEGHHGLKSRIAAWRQHFEQDDPDLYLSASGCDLNTPAGYNHAAENIRALKTPPRLIVVDTLHRFLDGDENSAQDAKTMLDACSGMMSEFGCSVLLVHHTGVSDEAQHRARGSSAWKGALENEISVIPPRIDGDSTQIVQRKAKDAETAEPVYVDLTQVKINGWRDEDGDPVTSCVVLAGAAPANAKKDGPDTKHRRLFEAAWYASGAEIYQDAPYVSRSSFEHKLETDGYKTGTIRNYLKPSFETGTIGCLMMYRAIETASNGWIITSPEWSSALMMVREAKSAKETD